MAIGVAGAMGEGIVHGPGWSHAESVVNDHGYSLEISPRPTSQLKFKSHAVARFREPGSSSRFCPRLRCITQNQVSQEGACEASSVLIFRDGATVMAMDFDVGVWLSSATLSTGISTLASGKYAAADPCGMS
jgi:hypothetical protein